MYTLAFDTTGSVASVGLVRDGKVLADYNLESANTHSTTLLPMAEHVMRVAGLTFDEVDLYACAVGPGSFTGLRIGVATVKGLAFKDDVPCVGVSSLEALAYNFIGSGDKLVCPVLNARRERVYCALFRLCGGEMTRITEDSVLEIGVLKDTLSAYEKEEIFFCGDGYDLIDFKKTNTPVSLRMQSGASAAILGERVFLGAEDKGAFSGKNLLPKYLQKTQAEREREARLKQES